LFDLEKGVPTDAYGLDEAVKEGFLVPLKSVSVPLKFQREGIRYDQLSEEEKEGWDALEWNEEGEIPDRVEAAAVNMWLFNKDTVDKVLEHLMTRGGTVAEGDRLGKPLSLLRTTIMPCLSRTDSTPTTPNTKGRLPASSIFRCAKPN
jgi:type I restriction enzyme, R subunit